MAEPKPTRYPPEARSRLTPETWLTLRQLVRIYGSTRLIWAIRQIAAVR